jgi:RNA polymerase sigma-70 factor, ECF subfamily
MVMEMTQKSDTADERLLRRMLTGDEDAFADLYRSKHPAIYRFALHMSGNAALAEDVTQEVFMALIREPGRFDPTRGSLGAFLFGIARNHLRKRWEQERRLVPIAGESYESDDFAAFVGSSNGHGAASASAFDDLESLDTIGRVRRAISTLPENYREVVVLCELEEMSYEEAAAALSCPVGTVRSRLHRARTILLDKLRDANPVRRASALGK